ncbi:Ubp12p [Sugiyamaella lignohabitans]|uniref:ubiquitinyl hydrolase 1 n=1 Tax=Sugiyamaella lignohabitans TaxID=796027 RepID=A0A161HJ96_9ASCO|nr:Ubp12p [Sugiyamaella lignohabitans]ANB12767.1 Ubp12p [Sugiyamaella lignohabitans]
MIGRYSSAFAGYSQQDSQEFVAFLLDGLHEDLNRIKQKPATEKPELPEDKVNDPDAIAALADECWELHKKRNDSVVLDLFAGLYRSVLVCPDCQKVSVTFDPFMDLTLPLPSDNLWIKVITVMPLQGRPILYEVAMDAYSTIRQLKEYIVKRLDMTKNGGADRLLCAEVYSQRIITEHEDRDVVSLKIQPNDAIVMYELDRAFKGEEEGDPFAVRVYNRTTRSVKADARKPPGTSDFGTYFGLPFYITLTSEEAKDEDVIRAKLSDRYMQLRGSTNDDEAELSEDEGSDIDITEDQEPGSTDVDGDTNIVDAEDDGEASSVNDEVAAEAQEDTHEDSTMNDDMTDSKVVETENIDEVSSLINGITDSDIVPVDATVSADTREVSKPLSTKLEDSFTISFIEFSPRVYSLSSQKSTKPLASRKPQSKLLDTPGASSVVSGLASSSSSDKASSRGSDSSESSGLDLDLMPLTGGLDDEIIPSYSQAISTPAYTGTPFGTMKDQTKAFSTVGDKPGDGETPVNVSDNLSDVPAEAPQLLFANEILVCDWKENLIDDWTPETVPNPEAEELRIAKETQKKTVIELSDCLDLFSKTEVLGQDDLWYCSRCQKLRQATKTIDLWKIPDIFTIHLKRFSSFRSFRDKISSVVNFPIEGLDMSDRVADKKSYQEGDLIYDLIAVDNHYGGLGGGHYTAYAKNFVDNKWYYYDDANVRPTEPEASITGAAYLLFYRRRSSEPLGGDAMKSLVEEARKIVRDPPPESESQYGGRSRSSSRRLNPVGPPRVLTRSADRFQGTGRVLGSSEYVTDPARDAVVDPLSSSIRHRNMMGVSLSVEDVDDDTSDLIRDL